MRRLNGFWFSLLCIFAATGLKGFSQASLPVSATGHISAEVIPVFSASETSQMNFGRFSPGPQGGRIILTPESTVSVIGSVYSGTGNHNAASFYVTGDMDAAYSITLPSSPVRITHMASAKFMTIDSWVSIPSPGVGTGMLQDGYQNVYIGATLNVGTMNDNPVGVYTGTYTVTFDFY
jgi:hypothetical protein